MTWATRIQSSVDHGCKPYLKLRELPEKPREKRGSHTNDICIFSSFLIPPFSVVGPFGDLQW